LADRKFEPAGFAAPLGHKDIRLALEAAEEMRVPTPLASLLYDRLLTLFFHGGDKLDWSAIGELASKDAAANLSCSLNGMNSKKATAHLANNALKFIPEGGRAPVALIQQEAETE